MSVTKKKILLITPSRIIARGITSILEEHGGFTVETVLTDLSRENEATVRDSMADIVIVDPIIFDFASRPAGRSRISDLTDETIKSYDETISIYDTPAAVISKLRNSIAQSAGGPRTENREELSAREKEILVCVAQGMLNKEIADRFHLSIYTVITHRKNITRKTGIKARPASRPSPASRSTPS